jgi:hypothetical protein
MKKIQVGARITEEDADFLNLLKINGANTPSDKLRAIIEEARQRREYSQDFTGLFRMTQEQLGPNIEKIKNAEFENDIHSALLARILEWLPDFYAFCLSAISAEKLESTEELKKYEKGAVDRVARLLESLLHLELSNQTSSYDPHALRNHVVSLTNIIQIITKTAQHEEKKL